MLYEFFISLRYLVSKKNQKFVSVTALISILGVLIGVMALNTVLAVMGGFEDELRNKILGVSSHIAVLSYNGPIDKYEIITQEIKDIPGVVGASPLIYGQAMLATEDNVSGTVIKGVSPDTAGTVTNIEYAIGKATVGENNKIEDIELKAIGSKILSQLSKETKSGKPPIILGDELSFILGVQNGDIVSLVSPFGGIGPFGPAPKTKSFEVVGLFDFGMVEHDSSVSYVNLKDAMKFFDLNNSVNTIEVKVDNIFNSKSISETISDVVGFPFYTRNWEEVNKSLFKALKLERFALSIILGLIILVAALNIISTLTMLVMEKNKDISILRAMGTKRGSIRRIFIIDGMIIGIIGTFLGTLFGYLFCYFLKTNETLRSFIPFDNKVYPISEFPVKIEPLYFVIVAICSLLICFIATMYPSYQASKKDPVEALRYE